MYIHQLLLLFLLFGFLFDLDVGDGRWIRWWLEKKRKSEAARGGMTLVGVAIRVSLIMILGQWRETNS